MVSDVTRVEKCPTCDHPLEPGNSFEVVQRMEAHRDWWAWSSVSEGSVAFVPGLGPVAVVAKNVNFNEEQGEDRPAFIIFEIGGKFYRKNGHADSYGGTHWDYGVFKEVKPVTKEITAYE